MIVLLSLPGPLPMLNKLSSFGDLSVPCLGGDIMTYLWVLFDKRFIAGQCRMSRWEIMGY